MFNPSAPLFPSGGGGGGGDFSGYERWLESPLGQRWNQAQESAAAYARKQADAEMANAKRALDIQVQRLRQEGRIAEAEIALKRGDQQIARDRLNAEMEIKRAEVAQGAERLGIERARAYTEYASTPDRLFMLGDLNDALTRAGQGLGPRPYGATGTPTPKTYEGFEALAAPTEGGGLVGSGQLPGAGGGAAAAGAGAAAGAPPDPRIKAAKAVMDASGISDELGTDANDQAALSAIQNIFQTKNIQGYAGLRPGQQKAFAGGLNRLGYYAPDAVAEIERFRPRQGQVTGA